MLILTWPALGIHPTLIAESFQRAATKAVEILTEMSTPVDLNDRETLLRAASTSLNSKVRAGCLLWPEETRRQLTPGLPDLPIRSSRSTRPSSRRSPSLRSCGL